MTGFHVFASDVRGDGDFTFFGSPCFRPWDTFADDLKLTVAKAMTPPIIGMGHSLGAVTTCIAAANYPQLSQKEKSNENPTHVSVVL